MNELSAGARVFLKDAWPGSRFTFGVGSDSFDLRQELERGHYIERTADVSVGEPIYVFTRKVSRPGMPR